MSDRYTKVALTVIATALIAIVVQNATGSLNAQTGVTKVVICDPANTSHCVSLGKHAGGWYYLAVSEAVK